MQIVTKEIQHHIQDIKTAVCDTRCRWLNEVNSVKVKSLREQKQLTEMLERACNECPLNKL